MIDIESLLAPIPGDSPEGADLHNPSPDTLVRDLRAAWSNARREEKREESGEAVARPDWVKVADCATLILDGCSKDLEAAALLVEAWAHTDDFAGLAAGGRLVEGLVQSFWPVLHPAPSTEEDDRTPEEARLETLLQVAGQDGRLLPVVRRIPLFLLPDGTAVAFHDCQQSRSWTALRPEQRTQRLAALSGERRTELEKAPGMQLWDALQQVARSGQATQLAALHHDIAAALAAWQGIGPTIAAQAGEERFGCRSLIELLQDIQRTVSEIAPPPAPEEPIMQETADDGATATTSPAPRPQALETRDDALRLLAEVAAFFRRSEPHSPMAYTLDEAIRRARLPWPELLAEVVPDKAQRDPMLQRLGIRPDAPG